MHFSFKFLFHFHQMLFPSLSLSLSLLPVPVTSWCSDDRICQLLSHSLGHRIEKVEREKDPFHFTTQHEIKSFCPHRQQTYCGWWPGHETCNVLCVALSASIAWFFFCLFIPLPFFHWHKLLERKKKEVRERLIQQIIYYLLHYFLS